MNRPTTPERRDAPREHGSAVPYHGITALGHCLTGLACFFTEGVHIARCSGDAQLPAGTAVHVIFCRDRGLLQKPPHLSYKDPRDAERRPADGRDGADARAVVAFCDA